jgi:hypothetical protein
MTYSKTILLKMTDTQKSPHKPYNLLNKRIGHVTVLAYAGTHNKMKKYLVRCECGNLHEAYGKRLMSLGENNTDFRCDKCRFDKLRRSKIEFIRFVDSKAWGSWNSMVKVCFGKNANINRSINKKWYDFFEFLKDMGEPKKDQCLFHVKQFGEYNKNNCKWADRTFVLTNARYI